MQLSRHPALALFTASLLVAACGTTPDNGADAGSTGTPDAGSTEPDAGGNDTPDAGGSDSPDAGGNDTPDAGGNDTPDAGGNGPTTAFVRFAFYSSTLPAKRHAFEALLDGAEISEGMNAAMKAAETPYFKPGTTNKWMELAPGEHTVTFNAAAFERICDNEDCSSFFDEIKADNKTVTFTAAAGEYFTVVGLNRLKNDDPTGESFAAYPESNLVALKGGPNDTDRFVSVFRWPQSMEEQMDFTVKAHAAGGEGPTAQATLAPGGGVVVQVPTGADRLTVTFVGLRGQLVTKTVQIPSNVVPGDVYPYLWVANHPFGPNLNDGPGGSFPPIVAP